MDLYLIRHTSVDAPAGLCYGRLDLEPAESFSEEVRLVQSLITNVQPAVCYTSPLKRCRKLAEALFERDRLTVDDRLKEMDFGEWEGQSWDNIDTDRLNRWMRLYAEEGPPNGESFLNLRERAMRFWEDLDKDNGNDVVVITHAGIIRSLLSHLLEIPLNKVFALNIDLGSLTQISYTDDFIRVNCINKTGQST